MPLDSRKFFSKFYHPYSAWIILACSILVTFVSYWASDYVVDQRAREIFRLRVKDATQAITGRINDTQVVLQSTVPLVMHVAGPKHWHQHVDELRIQDLFPGIIALGYVSHVPSSKLPSYLGKNGNPNKVRYSQVAKAYAPITFVSPVSAESQSVLGFDMYSERVRREAPRSSSPHGKVEPLFSHPSRFAAERV